MYGRSRCLSLHSSPRSLDNLINLVSLSLPTFFARHQVSSVSRQSLLSLSLSLPSLCFARLFTPSLPPSLLPLDLFSFRSTTSSSASSFSAAYLYHGSRDQWIDPVSRRKESLSSLRAWTETCVEGRAGAYHNSGWRDHSKFIRHRSGSPER